MRAKLEKLIWMALDPTGNPSERKVAWNRLHELLLSEGLNGEQFLATLGANMASEWFDAPVPPEECVHGERIPHGRYVGELWSDVKRKDPCWYEANHERRYP